MSAREPAEIRAQIERVERQRYGLHDQSVEHRALTAELEKLRAERAESDRVWAEHALSA